MWPKGKQALNRKLTDQQIAEVRRLFGTGEVSIGVLAHEYNVSRKYIQGYVSYRNPSSSRKRRTPKRLPRHPRKLTVKQVYEIRQRSSVLLRDGLPPFAVARRLEPDYPVGRCAITSVITYRSFKDV